MATFGHSLSLVTHSLRHTTSVPIRIHRSLHSPLRAPSVHYLPCLLPLAFFAHSIHSSTQRNYPWKIECFLEDLFLGGQSSIILGYRRLSVKSGKVIGWMCVMSPKGECNEPKGRGTGNSSIPWWGRVVRAPTYGHMGYSPHYHSLVTFISFTLSRSLSLGLCPY